MQRALDDRTVDVAVGERVAVVCARVVDRVIIVADPEDRDGAPSVRSTTTASPSATASASQARVHVMGASLAA